MNLQELGNQIKVKRLEAGLTQEELGKMIGTKKEGVYRMESGKQNIGFKTLAKLSAVLGGALKIEL